MNIKSEIQDVKNTIDGYNITVQSLPASATKYVCFNISANTLRESINTCNDIVTILKRNRYQIKK